MAKWIKLSLASLVAFLLGASMAFALPVELREHQMDDDGIITLGDLFVGAGSAAEVGIARRGGVTAVLDAGQVQAVARRHGLEWQNARGIRRIIVRTGAVSAAPGSAASASPGRTVEALTYARNIATGDVIGPQDIIWADVQAHQAASNGPSDVDQVIGQAARRPLRSGALVRASDLSAPQVIARGDLVEVIYQVGGVRLSLRARALENATIGELFNAENTESGRTIEVMAYQRGRALAGPAMHNASIR